MKNAVIAQSGGPTSVINNSIKGAIDVFLSSNSIHKVYGAKMGILGILEENLIDISSQDRMEIEKLSVTPSAGALGSCRYKIKSEEDLSRIVKVFAAHNIGYFLYCGGGDSMDTANKVTKLAKEKGLDLVACGIPKTIDNDVGGKLQSDGTFAVCDHDPGYGSVARNTAINVLEANQENMASYTSDPVLVIGVMGRKIGFIPAAARLADPGRKMPLLIILSESFKNTDPEDNISYIMNMVNERLRDAGRCIVVISEGVKLGGLGNLKDSFGHTQFSSSALSVEQVLSNYLNGIDRGLKSRLAVSGSARWEKPGTRQRRESAYVSGVDLDEAYQVGKYAAELALIGKSGYMSTIVRVPAVRYKVRCDKVPLDIVANSEREFPPEWITKDKIDVTDEFISWATPLIGSDLYDFTRFKDIYADKKLKDHMYYGYK